MNWLSYRDRIYEVQTKQLKENILDSLQNKFDEQQKKKTKWYSKNPVPDYKQMFVNNDGILLKDITTGGTKPVRMGNIKITFLNASQQGTLISAELTTNKEDKFILQYGFLIPAFLLPVIFLLPMMPLTLSIPVFVVAEIFFLGAIPLNVWLVKKGLKDYLDRILFDLNIKENLILIEKGYPTSPS